MHGIFLFSSTTIFFHRDKLMAQNAVIWLQNLRMTDVEEVGGKNASLGEMISQLSTKGVRVPGGFATTASAFRDFLNHNGLAAKISEALAKLDVEDVSELLRVGKEIRQWVLDTPFQLRLMRTSKQLGNKWSPKQVVRIFRLRCVLLPPPKICPMRLLLDNKKLS
jgi:phosphoenolpyruvate synthase/pyruvate phosphate dikinase